MKKLSTKIITNILTKGLAQSTWRDSYEEAYQNLMAYREDLIVDVESTLKENPLISVREVIEMLTEWDSHVKRDPLETVFERLRNSGIRDGL